MIRSLVITAAIICVASQANASNQKAVLARVTWSAFQCSTFAQMSGNTQQAKRLYELGIRAGREFLEALLAKQISQEDMYSQVPWGVGLLLGGPSADFMLGRIFENATQDAYDAVAKKDQNGVMRPMDQWVSDEALRKSIATTKFQRENCILIK